MKLNISICKTFLPRVGFGGGSFAVSVIAVLAGPTGMPISIGAAVVTIIALSIFNLEGTKGFKQHILERKDREGKGTNKIIIKGVLFGLET